MARLVDRRQVLRGQFLRGLLVLGTSLLLSCRAVGPSFTAPAVSVPPAFKASTAESSAAASSSASPSASPSASSSDSRSASPSAPPSAANLKLTSDWWTLLNDPQLDRLEQQALAANPSLAIAAARVERARAQWMTVLADRSPRLNADASVQRFRTSRDVATAPLIAGQRRAIQDNQFSPQLSLAWELDFWGRIQRADESSQAQLRAVSLDAQNARLLLSADVAAQYFQLRALDEEAKILTAVTRSRQNALRVAQARFDAGVTTDLDLQRARTELANAQAETADLARRREGAENALAVLTGQAPSELLLRVVADPLPPVPSVAAQIPADLLTRRADIAQALAQVEAAYAQIGVAQAGFYPQIRLTGYGGFASSDLSNLLSAPARIFSLGPSVSLPVLDGGRNRANLKAAEAMLAETQSNYQQRVLMALREVDDALAELGHRRAIAALQATTVEASGRAARVARIRYDQGAASYLEVTDTERTELGAQRAVVQTRGAQWAATIQLIKALGGGWSD